MKGEYEAGHPLQRFSAAVAWSLPSSSSTVRAPADTRQSAANASSTPYNRIVLCRDHDDERAAAPTGPASFYCPVSMELMSDPVMVATGHTYDRSCIAKWLAQGNRTCPVTGMRLRHLELVPNHALRSAIQVQPHCTRQGAGSAQGSALA